MASSPMDLPRFGPNRFKVCVYRMEVSLYLLEQEKEHGKLIENHTIRI